MSKPTKTIEVKGKKYTLTKYELHRANQMYDSIPCAEKTLDDWKWAIEMALQETRIREQEKRAKNTE